MLLFGVVLGLVAGYLSGKQRHKLLWLTLLVWVSARALNWGWPGSVMAIGSQCLFIVLMLYWILPRLGAAKRWRNQSLLWLLVGLGGLALWSQAGITLPGPNGPGGEHTVCAVNGLYRWAGHCPRSGR